MLVKNTNNLNTIAEIQVSYSTLDTLKDKVCSGKQAFELILNCWNIGCLELR